ncbi:hypothetical protein FG167_03900 [Lacinutrix sp. WUR7]|uniref:hypothetical protein n=1 Tax=Lacinutrix sp. WUR7 TaxID=2653681 RepID=UPI00193DF79A|nr:hypothetical protein [Lacinutrix sp. WUR7]QRM88399.1 hypothetical protein FG167_03900 [Lacinutrix sp. WUR7]
MKKLILTVVTSFLLFACSKNDNNNDNEYLQNYSFDTGNLINTGLVASPYGDLDIPGNYAVVPNYGINGIVVYYSGISYSAFELSDPNHHIQSCSTLTIEGIIASCDCEDGNSYEIVTGQPQNGTTGAYGLKPYFVEVSGNIIRVYNN